MHGDRWVSTPASLPPVCTSSTTPWIAWTCKHQSTRLKALCIFTHFFKPGVMSVLPTPVITHAPACPVNMSTMVRMNRFLPTFCLGNGPMKYKPMTWLGFSGTLQLPKGLKRVVRGRNHSSTGLDKLGEKGLYREALKLPPPILCSYSWEVQSIKRVLALRKAKPIINDGPLLRSTQAAMGISIPCTLTGRVTSSAIGSTSPLP